MSHLRICAESDVKNVSLETADQVEIATQLKAIGVRFEQWVCTASLDAGAAQEDVIAAYQADVDKIMHAGGFQTVDVVSLNADHPEKDVFRKKFLSEHTHSEDEVRFFVKGAGLFSLHLDGKVYEVECTQGDLISVPAGTPHWFDMGPQPSFACIRMFTDPAGWVANFTGSAIADDFNRFEA